MVYIGKNEYFVNQIFNGNDDCLYLVRTFESVPVVFTVRVLVIPEAINRSTRYSICISCL